jgi:hypothetical protein
MSMGMHTIYIAYEYDEVGYTGRYGYVNGYGGVPTCVHGTRRGLS